jgi:hypothetical protein
VAVALRVPAMGEEPLRDHNVKVVLRPRHRDVKEAAFFLQFRTGAGAEIGRHATIDDVQHEDRLPLLTFRRMDGRQDEVVLVEKRDAGLVAGDVGRIKRELGEETLA